MVSEEFVEGMVSEIRRGSIILCVLSCLKNEKYGYALVAELNEKGLTIEAGTLYPLLNRLERQGILTSKWNTEGSKPRKYYMISNDGLSTLEELKKSWRQISATVESMLGE